MDKCFCNVGLNEGDMSDMLMLAKEHEDIQDHSAFDNFCYVFQGCVIWQTIDDNRSTVMIVDKRFSFIDRCVHLPIRDTRNA